MVFAVNRLLVPASDWPATLTVVIDTEEEFDWAAPFDQESVAVGNIGRQGPAQALFDRHGVVPAYVIDYAVANSPAAADFLRPLLESGRCEIGAHLHPWVNPPFGETVDNFHSFPGNLPPALEAQKLAVLTRRIAEQFGVQPTIYKAGRYGLGPASAAILADLGYRIDVSIVPHTDFSAVQGPDFSRFTALPFETGGGLVALPLTVGFVGALAPWGGALFPRLSGKFGMMLHLPGLCARLGLLERLRLSPEGHTLDDLMRQTRAALARGQRFFMLTYHSSTLLPGTTAYVRDQTELQRFLSVVEGYLSFFFGECGGRSLGVSAAAAALTG